MEATAHRAIAIVGVGAILPDAPDANAFWNNVQAGRYSISDVTPDRWDPRLYFDPDPKAPEKSYSKLGGWVRDWRWDPLAWGMRILPAVSEAMDDGQKWAVACVREALADFGYPGRKLDLDRTAVILGNAMAGERHYLTALRVFFPEYAESLASAPSFGTLPLELRAAITAELQRSMRARLPDITEDTMPGELSNCIAGRVANLFNFRGPNFVVDAACASAMAAIGAAIEGLDERDFDTAIAGGIDRNMGPSAYVKFSKIGALSATGTRPYAAGADGFVMGEGAAVFLLKRLADAERDGDRVHAVIRGVGGSSDGKGKGITAPNPVGQKLAITRAWENAALSPATATLVEGHGTSTRVGDVVETQSLTEVFGASPVARGSIALGSVKSNIGHLKAAAGAAGLLKVVMALRDKVLPPSINFERPNPDIDFEHSPFAVNRELRPWDEPACGVRRAGLSAFGFGGTNFHLVLEEFVPGRLSGGRDRGTIDVPDALVAETRASASSALKAPLRGALVVSAASRSDLLARLTSIGAAAAAGRAPAFAPPAESDLRAPVRLAIDHGDAAELAAKVDRAKKALAGDNPVAWKALRGQGLFLGEGAAPKVAFLYTGQGSQYVNMLKDLAATEPVVKEVFAEADRVMAPLLGKPLTDYVFVDATEASAVAQAEEHLRQTAITQPAVLAVDTALTRLLAAYGVVPDVVMGHSLGEYAALVAAGALPFADALEAVSARGREMTNVSVADNGRMAAVMAPLKDVERILSSIDGYVVIANLNSNQQAVIGGASAAVAEAIERFRDAGFGAVPLNVSHAFHTEIVAPASEPLRRTLERLRLSPPRIPVVANVDGGFYPTGPDARERMLDLLARQVASPVQFVAGLRTLYASGVRLFVEVGPKRALAGFVDDVFGGQPGVVALHTNHPKVGDRVSFSQALCGLYAAGLGAGVRAAGEILDRAPAEPRSPQPVLAPPAARPALAWDSPAPRDPASLEDLGRMFADVLERGWQVYRGGAGTPTTLPAAALAPVVITGAALGLPGTERVFDDANLGRILHGQQFIDLIPTRFRRAILDKHITRLAKKADGAASFETIDSPGDVIKLAGRAGQFDLADEFGVALERLPALDVVTRLAIGAGLDALRDAGIPLVRRYKTTSKGTRLPDRWMLPEALRDDTAVVFASAFPGLDSFAADLGRFHADHLRHEKLALLERLRARVDETTPSALRLLVDLDEQIHEIARAIEKDPYTFDRRFLFRILAMGHSQFAELIGARGPNTHVNAACASTTQAVAVAEDWIREGRARRVIVVAGDDVTSDNLLEWIGSGFLASGAAATDDVVEEAAVPFDRRRHGMILGMGAAAFVVEHPDAVRARGLRPICEVLEAVTANSAFHGTRIDVEHVAAVMESLVSTAERRHGIRRDEIAAHTVFVSHETYTPARGGSAAAEVRALRQVFGAAADRIVIANTKGFTGHAMGVGIEDVVAIKALETGLIPPVANFKEADPELGRLNLSKGGMYPVRYALRLGAGFGSQISMTLCRWVATPDGSRPSPDQLGYRYRIADPAAFSAWLDQIAGQAGAELEVVKRTLRVVDAAAEARATEARRPTAPAVAPVAAPPAAPPAPAADAVKEQVLTLFAEKTGYPRDMLAEDLDLEADLGIDTVKQAELFATVRETFAIPREEKLKLRDFPTLGHVVGFVKDRRPDLVSTPPAAPVAAAAAVASPPVGSASLAPGVPVAGAAADPVGEQVLTLFAAKTGYPRDMLDLDLDLEADLGIDTVKQAELFATVRETFAIPREEKLKLRDFPTLGHVIGFVKDRRPDLVSTPPAAPVAAAAAVASPPVGSASLAPGVPAAVAAADPVAEQVLTLFAEKTGYPRDMLDLDLDLEADFGIDTVKQAELFATVRETFAIPREEKLRLRDFPTLGHVVGS
ncbi:MAG: acyltransferase domain-containing protein [Deltaproteobacteria bacterium]|nr:acyltransferase domain-containing protein [Deltaproteobacteria bacterium]